MANLTERREEKMLTTFHIIHIVIGLWIALVNFTDVLSPTTLAWNNFLLGLIIAAYNAYHLFARKDVGVGHE
ncbi:MAG: hypothetical protein GX364_01565 [Firmicutes bacterium]|jgi:hypothetical protein|nr:hypothetical protein [Bacillota bacterium]